MKDRPVLGLIVPAYNEEAVLGNSIARLGSVLEDLNRIGKISGHSYVCIVDDGSSDDTWQIICRSSLENPWVRGIRLSRNFGHQNALMAGMETCMADVYISIDADLQDDETTIAEMIQAYGNGSQVVYGIRRSRDTDSALKRFSALSFYRIMNVFKTGVIYNHADFRLLSRRAVLEIGRFREVNLFLRAIIPLIGLKTSTVYYDRKERLAGETKYSLGTMLAFAWEGITSFSTIPLRFVSVLGMSIFLLTVMGAAYSVYQKLFGHVVPGWTSTVLPIFFIGGIQLLCVGVLGEYIGKIYQEVKGRPRYIVEEQRNFNKDFETRTARPEEQV
ncbi:MAG: glycosyltransferase family 2 protein [Pseudomonadota bacterium]